MIEGEANQQLGPVFGIATLRQRSNFAVQHLMAAARFSKMCGEIEIQNKGQPLGPFFDVQIGYVSATVLLATASLEAYINEVWADGENSFPELKDGIRLNFLELIEDKPILEKFQRTLLLKGVAPFPEGEQPYKDAQALIRLRNALVHFKPEWHDEQEQHKKIEKQLKGKFEINPFIGENGVFFPQQCMSYGCTKWAVLTVLSFVSDFCNRTPLENKYVKFQERIDPVYMPDA
jgi:hypothetical protein